MSPAKGILLTPRTVAGRRKTVSFGSLEGDDGIKLEEPQQISQAKVMESQKEVSDTVSPEEAKVASQTQPTLTKELFEAQLDASKQRLNEHQKPTKPSTKAISSTDEAQRILETSVKSAPVDTSLDATVDLRKPRSQSGQHWKAEYERYQKNSDRELKKIIQYGQNVKSYAEKKDVEATDLQEKLKRELAKCAAMEVKVSNLATQLVNSKKIGPEGSEDQEKLMNDLSQQTAQAIRYKQKADRYKVAIKQQNLPPVGAASEEHRYNAQNLSADVTSALEGAMGLNHFNDHSELTALRNEIHALRTKLDAAEEKTAKLEAVNAKLTKNFLRVKDEMQNYDARRVRKETRLKQREEKLLAEKKVCEGKLRQLTQEHEELLRSIKDEPVDSNIQQEPLIRTSPRRQSLNRSRSSPLPEHSNDRPAQHPANIGAAAQSSHIRTKTASKGPAIDIWTMDTPNDTADMTPPAAEPAVNLSHIALSETTNNALQELDQNSVTDFPSKPLLPPDTPRPTLQHLAKMDSALQPDFPSSEAYVSSAAQRMNDRRTTIASPRPSMVSMASSAVKEQDTPRAAGLRRNANLVSAAGSRRSALGGGRSKLEELPPDRAAAARARLAQRKSMKENRQA